jgi:hypothetical protein
MMMKQLPGRAYWSKLRYLVTLGYSSPMNAVHLVRLMDRDVGCIETKEEYSFHMMLRFIVYDLPRTG